MQNKRTEVLWYKTSTTFDIGTQNVRGIDFPSLASFSLPGK